MTDEPLVIDVHTHGTHLLPGPIKAVHRATLARSWPEDTPFTELRPAGVDAVMAKAVGDRLVTRWRWPATSWTAVRRQLDELRSEAEAAGAAVATTTAEVRRARDAGRSAVILGLEGADVVGEEPARLAELHAMGLRVLGLVHYDDNALGTICMSWDGSESTPGVRAGKRRAGLTPLGAEVVDQSNELGIVIDLAHADRATTLDVCERTSAPVISSHTGARMLQDFPRYLSDEEVRAIAGTGGLIGLWPYGNRGRGVSTVDEFCRHAIHLAEVAGPGHLCIGTDMNGVKGLMAGYRGGRDFSVLTDALRRAGFCDSEVAGIAGGNMTRLLTQICD